MLYSFFKPFEIVIQISVIVLYIKVFLRQCFVIKVWLKCFIAIQRIMKSGKFDTSAIFGCLSIRIKRIETIVLR